MYTERKKLAQLDDDYDDDDDTYVTVGIGDNSYRAEVERLFTDAGWSLVHEEETMMGSGCELAFVKGPTSITRERYAARKQPAINWSKPGQLRQ